MWILLVLVINYSHAASQMSVEFSSKDACVAAANEYKSRIEMLPSSYPKIVVLCAKK